MTPEECKLKNYWNNIKELAEWANSAYHWARDGNNANAVRNLKKVLDTYQNEVFLQHLQELIEALEQED